MGADAAPVAAGGEGPPALSAHLAKLRQAAPGDNPDGGAADAFLARAYPTGTIPVAAVNAARSSFEATESRRLGGDDDNSATWQQLGPTTALYPFEPLRRPEDYLPNEYVAGGRTTSVALAESCGHRRCTMYIATSGGGVWRTDDALDDRPRWRYLGGPLGINAAGSVTIDPNDRSGNTVYVGTGEANICGSGCVAGVGIYRTRDGGRHWEGPLGQAELAGKGIGEITIHPRNPNVIYAATTTALRGLSSVCCFGVTRPVPGAAQWGLYKSTDGGRTWGFVHNGTANPAECKGDNAEFLNQGTCSPRGVREVKLDPGNPSIVYAASFARGVWRSPDAGTTWEQIKPSLNPTVIQTRPAISINRLRSGATRMYLYEGGVGTPFARLFRSDSVAAGTPAFVDLTSANPADPGYATFNQCFGQCWYDVFVHTPPGHPDIVYTGGSYDYDSFVANHRGVVLSTDAGVSGTDMTFDGTSRERPNALHPDQHDIVTNPRNPLQFWEASDGGVMRSSGQLVNRSRFCDGRGHAEPALSRCRQMLSAVPSRLESLNNGLNTLQFQSLSVSPHDPNLLQGGTQDNGTWQNTRRDGLWVNTMIGDGGQSGFDVRLKDFRFHTFQATQPEVNFFGGKTSEWIYIADPLVAVPGNLFYAAVISDPRVSGTMFAGTGFTVHRTKTFGLGDRSREEANRICNSWTGTFEAPCGDWEELGTQRLTDASWGSKAGGAVAAIERVATDSSTAWAATSTGRVFVTHNVDAEPASAVIWGRVDDDTAASPNRFVTSIAIDPADPDRAWVSYSGFDANTPQTPGHVFEVTVDDAGLSTWADRSFNLGDQPVSDLVRDDPTGDLYASTDFGVLRLSPERSQETWVRAAAGMPNVEVPGLTIVPGSRLLYAASHGLGAWRLKLDDNDQDNEDGQRRSG
ncbi:MAG TPA: hypothetical protein VFV67_22165 [Actinophytocola sp.]|uniref:hypothetical protein n=1 Tax=Actinophytocola sp. TaxID=1872138 RepID=UPI002DB6FD72|nr:hypothetical protein [Actinophytocola sp.]HEU5473358.1 hypothetical protein [Actinophytocola sp.]